jgi:hypothetical protein
LTPFPALITQGVLLALMAVSICWVVADTDSQPAMFQVSVPQKQPSFFPVRPTSENHNGYPTGDLMNSVMSLGSITFSKLSNMYGIGS